MKMFQTRYSEMSLLINQSYYIVQINKKTGHDFGNTLMLFLSCLEYCIAIKSIIFRRE